MLLTGNKKYPKYEDYLRHQMEKTLDPIRREKWLGKEWGLKLGGFRQIFSGHQKVLATCKKALCLGARTGQEVEALREIGLEAIGVDLVPREPLVIRGDFHHLPFKEHSIDFIFTNSFDHALDPQRVASEIERVLKPGGYFLLHLQIGLAQDAYTETVIPRSRDVLRLFRNSKIVLDHRIHKNFAAMNWEILLKKKEFVSLVLFFTENMSLKGWERRGILDRELMLYRRLFLNGIRSRFVTYGKHDEITHFDGIEVIRNRWGLPNFLYKIMVPLRHLQIFLTTRVLKTNQIRGASYAVALKRLFRKKLIVRFGDLASWTSEERQLSSLERSKLQEKEGWVFRNADHILAPTEELKAYVHNTYAINTKKITVVPNMVDTEQFKPGLRATSGSEAGAFHISCIAKNKESQKNLISLFKALEDFPNVILTVIGRACENTDLRDAAKLKGLNVKFTGTLPYHELPAVLCSSDLYVQPSFYEGHPKAILEAMSCALPVIGCNVPGIKNVICHQETGVLCGTTPIFLREAIAGLMGDPNRRRALGRQARLYVQENCSLEKVVKIETDLIHDT
jgi:glycosyltransferase involved in cell wall biosynthesis